MTVTVEPTQPVIQPARVPLTEVSDDNSRRIVQRVLADADEDVASTLDVAAFNSSI